jgi:hypothetical protein
MLRTHAPPREQGLTRRFAVPLHFPRTPNLHAPARMTTIAAALGVFAVSGRAAETCRSGDFRTIWPSVSNSRSETSTSVRTAAVTHKVAFRARRAKRLSVSQCFHPMKQLTGSLARMHRSAVGKQSPVPMSSPASGCDIERPCVWIVEEKISSGLVAMPNLIFPMRPRGNTLKGLALSAAVEDVCDDLLPSWMWKCLCDAVRQRIVDFWDVIKTEKSFFFLCQSRLDRS